MSELTSLTLTQVAARIRAREVSSLEVLDACIARAESVNPKLNAFLRIDAELARDAARLADAELARGRVRGPLHGVPMAHKDMFYREGVPSSCGSRIKGERPEAATATALARLDAAGAIQFGVLHMSEFAYNPTGHNAHFGPCRNPWDTARITGGSSSGAGAAVAARATYAALGSDTGGSVRLPAAFNGVTGLKPTYGRVSRAGAMPLSFSLDTIGPLARTAADCAVLLAALAGCDAHDPTASAEAAPDYVAHLGRPVKGLRLGVAMNFFTEDVEPGVGAALTESLKALESLGCEIVPVTLPDLAPMDVAGAHVLAAEAASIHGAWLRTRPDDYSPQVLARLERGLALPATKYIDALRYRGPALAAFSAAVFARVDVLHAPVAPIATPTIAETDVGASAAMDRTLGLLTRFTRPINFLGLPALALPAGFTAEGLPVGMQLVGRPFSEDLLLRLGDAFQRATDWHERAPAV
ncbi:MAG: amidase [Burkholderiales bacterium]|nr:amidase [Burkholderiales bacterium]